MEFLNQFGGHLLFGFASASIAYAVAHVLTKSRNQQELALLEHELESEKKLANSQLHQLTQQVEKQQQELDELDLERDKLAQEQKQSHGRLMAAMEKLRYFDAIQKEKEYLTQQLEFSRQANSNVEAELREQEARNEEERKASQEKIELLERAEERLKQQFENLANQLFEQKTKTVDEQNKVSLEGLLSPLKEQLEGFKKQVNDSFGFEAKERHTLVHEIRSLQQLNERMTQEAVNLTNALKGDNKQQGNWGEVVLSRVLKESGLREGHEYDTQVSMDDEDGKRFYPDVIVHLPDEKDVVVDSKMTLVAYERFFNSEDFNQKEHALDEHLMAIRAHLRGLSKKDYHKLNGLRSLDYVLMFIPVEPAFQVAIEADPSLISDAMEQNIIIVSPTTLLVALRTISNLWRNERQNQNAKIIAERASKLYDKMRLFVDDMEAVGGALDKANQSYQGAMNKLASGRGNLIRQAESFKELGVEVKRDINRRLIDQSFEADTMQTLGDNGLDKVD
ncbi:DNA recombination protein RmuC [Aliivibrio fischeri]|uniref:DNA recombination protein RmuC n=1 Tax=Aliivibrio fischeri TaxID=668 RepID=A0A844NYP5_ALIFS|nr:DNA recombination protein RmuC [Aliivibrio fischeri]MUK29354.1 DNA recombination protein RmuC [Aliivibrio fischeri]MUK48157.1 DNA recombination protein RmuC [Aliivibrio fischeri]MUK65446.1 DNA recombination protein RmuC [Aliivibrio fischeri]